MALKFSKMEIGGGKRAAVTRQTWSGTPVPNTHNTTINEIYFNTNLSKDEVEKILSQLTYDNDSYTYLSIKTSNYSAISCVVSKGTDGYRIGCYIESENGESNGINDVKYTNITVFNTRTDLNQLYYPNIHSNGWQANVDTHIVYTSPISVYDRPTGTHGLENDLLTSLISITPFIQGESEVTLELEGNYDGSTMDVVENQTLNIKSLIENDKKIPLNVNIDVAAKSVVEGEWTGTAVPNTGTVEKVYLNTNLSDDKVLELLNSIDMTEADQDGYALLITDDNSTILLAVPGYQIYGMFNGGDLTAVWANPVIVTPDFVSQFGFAGGWNPNLTYPIEINTEILSEMDVNGTMTTIGDQNDKLSALFSTTPFTQDEGESVEIKGKYDGSSVSVTENQTLDIKSMIENDKKIPLEIEVNVESVDNARIIIPSSEENKPTLPVEGYDQSIYFNTKLTEDEVNDILSAIEFEGSSNEYIVCYFEEGSSTYKLAVTRDWYNDKPVHNIVYGSSDIFTSYTGGSGSSGWSSWMSNPIKGNLIQPGSQNDKIVNVFSGTPFSYEVPGDGSLVDIYVNTALSVEEVDAILDTIEMGGSNDSYTAYYIEYGSDGLRLCVRKGYPGWIIDNEIMGERLYDSTGGSGASFHGWNPDFDGVIEILNFKENDPGMVYGVSIYDNQNDKLANLFSIAPFEVAEPIAVNLSGDYDGSSIEITENGSVDIKELIENDLKIPLSIDVNVDAVSHIIDGDTTVEVKGDYDGSEIKVTENGYLNVGQLIDKGQLPLYIDVDVAADIIDGDTTVEVKGDYDGSSIYVTENGTVNIESLINKGQLPLNIEVDVTTDVIALDKGTPIPGDGSVTNIYVNTTLPPYEINNIIKTFGYLDSEYQKFGNEKNNTYTYYVYKFTLDGVEYYLYIKYWDYYKYSEINLKHPDLGDSSVRIFYSGDHGNEWKSTFNGYINITGLAGELIVNALANDRNNQLSRLFSTKPFNDVHIELEGEYDGSEIEVTAADNSEFTIDLKPYIELGKLPLTIKVKK